MFHGMSTHTVAEAEGHLSELNSSAACGTKTIEGEVYLDASILVTF
jgi:hypothetical protein